jgi:hypothetical protein
MAQMANPKGNMLDPACGAGIMLVESIKNTTNEQVDKSVFYGQDIDLTCVKMCALNLTFFNVNGFIIWGDSLNREVKKVYQTKRSYLGGSIRILNEEEVKQLTESYQAALSKIKQADFQPTKRDGEPSVTETTKHQLQLF